MQLLERLICALAGHRYVVTRVFSEHSRQVGCTRCNKLWAMNDDVRVFLPWDCDFERFYRTIGQWPGKCPKTKEPLTCNCECSKNKQVDE